MYKKKIEIRGLPTESIIEHFLPSEKSSADITKARLIMARGDEEIKKHPNCKIQIRGSGNEYYLYVFDEEDMAFEKRLEKSKEIHQKQFINHRAETRKFFLY